MSCSSARGSTTSRHCRASVAPDKQGDTAPAQSRRRTFSNKCSILGDCQIEIGQPFCLNKMSHRQPEPVMDFDLTHEQRQILDYGDTVAKKFDRKYWMGCADKREFPQALYQQIAED